MFQSTFKIGYDYYNYEYEPGCGGQRDNYDNDETILVGRGVQVETGKHCRMSSKVREILMRGPLRYLWEINDEWINRIIKYIEKSLISIIRYIKKWIIRLSE